MFTIVSRSRARIGAYEFHAGPGVKVVHETFPGDGKCCGRPDKAERGVQIEFPNGFKVSVLWGSGNYCELRGDGHGLSSPDAEVAVCRNGSVQGDVSGWMSPDDVLALIPVVAGLPRDANVVRRMEYGALPTPTCLLATVRTVEV
jgi:hypothetical protein